METKRSTIVIVSVFFALLMWFSVNMKDEYTIMRRMPVIIENMKDGKALRYPIPRTVSVRFRGNGWSLAVLYLSPDIRYYIDVSSAGMGEFLITGKELLEHIKLTFPLQPLDVKPDTMIVALDDYHEKRVPVNPRLVMDFKEGFGEVGAVQLVPESVTVGGSKNLIAQITGWPTVYRKFENLRSPIDMALPLEESPTLSVDVSGRSSRLTVNVQPFAEKTFAGIPIVAMGVPPNREVIFIPPRVDLIVRGGIDQLAKLSNDAFQASVNFQTLLGDSTDSILPVLTGPDGCKIVSRKPEQFQFVIRKKL
jgi:YbbR domain-containing protein